MSKPPIRWRRGFFRFWVLLAGIWMLIAVPIAINGLLNPYVSNRCVATLIGDDSPTLMESYSDFCLRSKRAAEAGELVTTEVTPDFLLYTLKETSGPQLAVRIEQARALVSNYVGDASAGSRWTTVLYFGIWGLGFPLAVLIMGWAVAWAISGFSGRTVASD